LVPYAHSGDDTQIANAKVFSSAGAARWVQEENVRPALDRELARELLPLVVDAERRRQMAQKMQSLARPQAPAEIARVAYEVLYGKSCARIAA
jgi:UDP-N-acetylglucosamine:LPS N-acetylglucosamine transferase